MARVLCARSAHVALRYSLLSKLQWWENWIALRGYVSSYCRPLSWGLGTLHIRSVQNAERRGGVAVCCFVKVTHPPFNGSIRFAAPSAIGSLDRHMLSARLLLEGG